MMSLCCSDNINITYKEISTEKSKCAQRLDSFNWYVILTNMGLDRNITLYGIKNYRIHGPRYDWNKKREIGLKFESVEAWCQFLENILTSEIVEICLRHFHETYKFSKLDRASIDDAVHVIDFLKTIRALDAENTKK